MNSIKVSIITVCYNSEKTIKDTMESVLNQTYNNIEYIIIDGKSKDNTIEIIKSYEEKFKEKGIIYKWVSEQDKGIYDAMNKGIKMCNGDLIGVINSDDWYELDAVEKIVNNYSEEDVIYGTLRIIKDEKEYGISTYNYEFLGEIMIPFPTCFVKKDVYIEKKYDVNHRYAADHDFMISIYKTGKKFKRIEKVIANFRLGGAGESIKAKIDGLNVMYKHSVISKKIFQKRMFFLKIAMLKSKVKKYFGVL